ncbi:MAG: phage tail protein [Desmonostoc vinosum HA7617-LM4]|jgi:phage tail-like protein|nr:phage tail protein [Desmonostoc vinosum HA7617-LM4]
MPGEFLTGAVFYLEADGITDKFVQSVDGLGSNTGGTKGVVGSGKNGKVARQNTPGQAEFDDVTITVNYDGDNTIYQWYLKCNKDGEPREWDGNRKAMSVVGYGQSKDTEIFRINMKNCYPTKYTAPKFDAKSGDIVTEQITVSIQGFEIISKSKTLKS